MFKALISKTNKTRLTDLHYTDNGLDYEGFPGLLVLLKLFSLSSLSILCSQSIASLSLEATCSDGPRARVSVAKLVFLLDLIRLKDGTCLLTSAAL